MNERILDWLLEEENPSVRYAALTTLCGCTAEDPEVKSARNAIMEHGVVPNIYSGKMLMDPGETRKDFMMTSTKDHPGRCLSWPNWEQMERINE